MARREPALYVIEDAHWIDEVSESMLADFLAVIPQTHSMVLITYRPEYRGSLATIPGAQTISRCGPSPTRRPKRSSLSCSVPIPRCTAWPNTSPNAPPAEPVFRARHEATMESIELMGKEILPEFIERDESAVAEKANRLAPVIE